MVVRADPTSVSYKFRFCPIHKRRHERRVPENIVLNGSQSPAFMFTTAKKSCIRWWRVQAVQHDGLVVLVKIRVLIAA